MNWISVKDKLPDTNKLGDGNYCEVEVRTSRNLIGKTIYGSSGAPGEGYGFSLLIETDCGKVSTMDSIVDWRPLK